MTDPAPQFPMRMSLTEGAAGDEGRAVRAYLGRGWTLVMFKAGHGVWEWSCEADVGGLRVTRPPGQMTFRAAFSHNGMSDIRGESQVCPKEAVKQVRRYAVARLNSLKAIVASLDATVPDWLPTEVPGTTP